jgi:anti-sigma regulatory factor (Ser/Thr protein kinase)
MVPATLSITITENSQVGEARRRAAALAADLGLSAEDRGRISLIATEAASNIVKHAQSGEILLNVLENSAGGAVELLAVDQGKGMLDIPRCMEDGYSSGGTPGKGLGAIQRQSDVFDIHSESGRGTVAMSRVGPGAAGGPDDAVIVGAVSVPKPGETQCGDSWAVIQGDARARLCVVDGLGHGPDAARAAQAAIEVFQNLPLERPSGDVMVEIDRALRPTRGAVMAITTASRGSETLTYCGIGNISAAVAGLSTSRSMVSLPGTLGHAMRPPQSFDHDWPAEALLLMMSDGISSQAGVRSYTGLFQRHPSVIAATLYRDFRRGRDDATVLVARWRLSDR